MRWIHACITAALAAAVALGGIHGSQLRQQVQALQINIEELQQSAQASDARIAAMQADIEQLRVQLAGALRYQQVRATYAPLQSPIAQPRPAATAKSRLARELGLSESQVDAALSVIKALAF